MSRRPTGEALAQAVEKATGHAFADAELMRRALTHSSVRARLKTDNERLEFLGDRVLGLIVADLLFHAYPDADQGELAVRHSALVSGDTCAEIAGETGLAELIHADSGVRGQKARKARNIRADAVEAVIAALYLDGGMAAAEKFVLAHWEPRSRVAAQTLRDPKTALQEWAHQVSGEPPVYEMVDRSGPDHDPVFTIAVQVGEMAPEIGARALQARGRTAGGHRADGARGRLARQRGSQLNEPAEEKGAATRSGFVALIGAPNAGKSTLLNRLVGAKVSIVTHKVQTTRALVRGIATHGDTQIVFVDTPGIFRPKRTLDRAMVTTAWGGAKDADMVLVLIDAERGLRGDAEAMLENLGDVRQSKVLVLNKVDRVKRETLLALAAEANERVGFEATFMISALTGSGCEDLLDYLAKALPEGPWFYPEDQISDLPMRQLAAEITREKLYLRLHQELPYSSHVETEKWEEKKNGVRIEQVIYVERDSQKKIVLGRKGETIRAIGQAARLEIAEILEQPVHLFLFVKVRENWGNDPERYREMGLEFPR